MVGVHQRFFFYTGALTVWSLDVVAFTPARLHLQQLHGPVQETVDHFEAWASVVVNGTETATVPRSNIWSRGERMRVEGEINRA